mmetsp:Transcript_21922/g.19465  ORF Transcript_21922/g.19465 Transcript_21922/m.19465 type:complete len:112 (-) Transcript_21922:34-369(-)
MATKSKETYIKSFLNVFFEEDKMGHTDTKEVVKATMDRLMSITKPYFDKNVSQISYIVEEEDKRAEIEENLKEAEEKLSRYRFNQTAYDLIQEASDHKTLHEMHPLFVSWF